MSHDNEHEAGGDGQLGFTLRNEANAQSDLDLGGAPPRENADVDNGLVLVSPMATATIDHNAHQRLNETASALSVLFAHKRILADISGWDHSLPRTTFSSNMQIAQPGSRLPMQGRR